MNTAYLCLGGNMGDRESLLQHAIALIGEQAGTVSARSGIYETEAWGTTGAAYLNCCVELQTALSPQDLMQSLLGIELSLGRHRGPEQYAPRLIDIDILFYNTDTINETHLHIPHPRMQLRRFVLKPLCDIAPGFVHPVLHRTVRQLLQDCEDQSEVHFYR